jgi:hypothetical protein
MAPASRTPGATSSFDLIGSFDSFDLFDLTVNVLIMVHPLHNINI